MKHKCKNALLQSINEIDNLGVNGSKDSIYNDIISFERFFEKYDYDLLILREHHYGNDGKKFVYTTNIGVYDDIGKLARDLRPIFYKHKKPAMISAMQGDDLEFTIYKNVDDLETCETITYTVEMIRSNTLDEMREGEKWHIV